MPPKKAAGGGGKAGKSKGGGGGDDGDKGKGDKKGGTAVKVSLFFISPLFSCINNSETFVLGCLKWPKMLKSRFQKCKLKLII